ncbi:GNAT family N-acetyltransferase [Rhodoblastus acidophilus]|uniref:GNAT family N-acetyltransferase n=1 Tax=Candidatus Rhodoblastus alkanivorans TaxID=2954117 RepID=A0ABS9Z8V5_9HYPH|nr:GNAT family N-acetyltransferase [Candidatus Rhodoblastus alkanivorans]MCI4677909.1 GNAT family N-acetyltransferase [Candidatus Rhodoblastus alkanivorans]MCI4683805.1 GNAT family N-acetyltransferase [Candidatus Rhodoblastus alkanivorans]MDI4641123.1 GNAT family N-acetyltransferase [Rhodoblastus acidophilus]
MKSIPYRIRQVEGIDAIPASAWDACANPAEPGEGAGERFNPFLAHAFLAALEETGCVGKGTGWYPAHIMAEAPDGKIAACAPVYFKTHSLGEYVFDQGLADAYQRAGGSYYPKAQVATPFTPVQGRRLLVAADAPPGAREALLTGLRALPEAAGVSSLHVTFPDAADQAFFAEAGMIQRKGQQFHFFNRGYQNFDDFLAALSSRKRKAIRKERAEAIAHGVEIEKVTGKDLTEAHWDAFFDFYTDTSARKWGRPYLTRAFFSKISAALADRILLVIARREGRLIAGALNLIGDDALYGRNWGAIEHHPCLHFELCYYQAIEFAIERGLKRVEAGAQGEHKFARGYEAIPTFSAHEFADPRLAAAAQDYFAREARAVDALIAEYGENGPFKKE